MFYYPDFPQSKIALTKIVVLRVRTKGQMHGDKGMMQLVY